MATDKHPHPLPRFAPDETVSAVLHTSQGEIECVLHAKDCPMTVGNFVGLAEGTIAWKSKGKAGGSLYQDTVFHRVIPDFMVQAGDPLGNGTGGPGYQFADECKAHLQHDKPGILSMANAGPNTNGSQFFITEAATPWLNGRHTVFGEVTRGLDVVHAIANVKRDHNDRPLEEIRLLKVEIRRASKA